MFDRHVQLVLGLNAWLHRELSQENDPALEEVNELIIERNQVLTGDRQEAERMSQLQSRQDLGGSPTP